ncbi:MAG: hypothetical protein IH838_13275 [Proteobacteria bacterium]|nr:hypothetical protein [Pseudomonadota bacterium]
MAANPNPEPRIPVVCVDECAVAGAELFDPNSWPVSTKRLIQSCSTEYAVLHHCVTQLVAMCDEREEVCQKHVTTIHEQWSTQKFDLQKVTIYGQHPDLHIRIKAFFSGIKSLLDLLVQVLSTEKIVSAKLHGFHRVQANYGGTVLNALENNAPDTKKEVAANIHALISEHKKEWIDEAIIARDQLVHPEKGMHQLMFHLEFSEEDGKLVCQKINAPAIEAESIDTYTQRILELVQSFTSSFIGLVKAESNKSLQRSASGGG